MDVITLGLDVHPGFHTVLRDNPKILGRYVEHAAKCWAHDERVMFPQIVQEWSIHNGYYVGDDGNFYCCGLTCPNLVVPLQGAERREWDEYMREPFGSRVRPGMPHV